MGSTLGKMLGSTPYSREQVMFKSGANFHDQNQISFLHAEGKTLEQIQALTKVNMKTIKGLLFPPEITPDIEPSLDEED